MKKVLVTGANGFVGSNLCKELLNDGYLVRGMHREGSNLSALEGLDVELVEGDLRDLQSLKRAMQDVEIVFHIAALFRQAKHPDSVYHDINTQGVKNVLDTAIESGVNRVIHCSTVGVHSHIPEPPADENEPYRPGDIYQDTKCEGEKIALSYFREAKIPGIVIRPAMISGPGDKRLLKLFKGIAHKKMPLIGSGKTLVHWVLVSDLARAFRLAGEKESASGEIYIISGENPVSMRKLFETIGKVLDVKAPIFRVPALPVQIVGSIVEAICIPLGIEPPIYRRRVDFFTKTRAFDSSTAHRDLGYKAEFSFEQEVEKIALWYRDNGWL